MSNRDTKGTAGGNKARIGRQDEYFASVSPWRSWNRMPSSCLEGESFLTTTLCFLGAVTRSEDKEMQVPFQNLWLGMLTKGSQGNWAAMGWKVRCPHGGMMDKGEEFGSCCLCQTLPEKSVLSPCLSGRVSLIALLSTTSLLLFTFQLPWSWILGILLSS